MKWAWMSSLLLVVAGCTGGTEEAADASTGSVAGSCTYRNPFSRSDECRAYTGSGWTSQSAASDCASRSGTYADACTLESTLGRCWIDETSPEAYVIAFPGSDTSVCASSRTGCEVFAGGRFEGELCGGGTSDGGVVGNDGSAAPSFGSVFLPPTEVCQQPLSQPSGMSPGGEVCTWTAISGCTEPGRKFAEYASCDTVRTQRPYYPAPPAQTPSLPNDTRASDPEYAMELAWVTEQVEACACVCCHQESRTPNGPSNWYIDAPGLWVDTMGPEGLALAAGWVSSTALGAYPPEDNNGFERDRAGLPTTDADRMVAFFEAELARRGLTREDFVSTRPFGGPIYDQLVYTPESCASGVGVDSSGNVRWTGGEARYVYVLSERSANPGVPPNLDLPAGTLWRIDVAPTDAPIAPGFAYGTLPTGATQKFPEAGAPPTLESGATYYLYVLADVGIPLARCLFAAP